MSGETEKDHIDLATITAVGKDTDAAPERTASVKKFKNVREMKQSNPSVSLIHHDSKYKCCCASIHVKQGALLIGYLSILSAIAIFVLLLFTSYYEDGLTTILLFVQVIACLISAALLILAVKRKQPLCTWPFIIYQGIQVVLSLLATIYFLSGAIWPDSSAAKALAKLLVFDPVDEELELREDFGTELITMQAIIIALLMLISAILSIWWLRVAVKCRNWLYDTQKLDASHINYANGSTIIGNA